MAVTIDQNLVSQAFSLYRAVGRSAFVDLAMKQLAISLNQADALRFIFGAGEADQAVLR